MQVKIPTENGALAAKYSKQASPAEYYLHNPKISFPFEISAVPAGTQSLALTFVDDDAIPVSGFTWIHWIAANLPADTTSVPENASLSGAVPMVQGNNSNAGGLVHATDPLTTQHYTGPLPPDKDHGYRLTVYALDKVLDLQPGYWLNEFYHQIDGHVLATASQTVIGRA